MSHTTTREPRKIICPPTATLVSICTARTTRETYLGPIGETWSSRRHLKEVWALHAWIIFARVLVKIFIQVDRRFPRRSEIFVIIVSYNIIYTHTGHQHYHCPLLIMSFLAETHIGSEDKKKEYKRYMQAQVYKYKTRIQEKLTMIAPRSFVVVHDHVHVPQCQCWQS